MAGIITSEADKFLQATLGSARAVDAKNVPDDFLLRFAQYADAFTVSCCDRFAGFLKEMSIHGEVRGTSEAVLAKLVRNRCFESLDGLLSEYLDLLRTAKIDISSVVRQLVDSRVRDLFSMPGAALGAGGEGEQRKLLLPQAARAAALVKILDYLNAFPGLVQEFLDYGTSKLFGGDVDFSMQERFLRTVLDGAHEKMMSLTVLLEGLEQVKQRKWEQQRATESATIKAVAMMAGQSQVKRKTGVSSLVICGVCLAPIWPLFQLGLVNRYVHRSRHCPGTGGHRFSLPRNHPFNLRGKGDARRALSKQSVAGETREKEKRHARRDWKSP